MNSNQKTFVSFVALREREHLKEEHTRLVTVLANIVASKNYPIRDIARAEDILLTKYDVSQTPLATLQNNLIALRNNMEENPFVPTWAEPTLRSVIWLINDISNTYRRRGP